MLLTESATLNYSDVFYNYFTKDDSKVKIQYTFGFALCLTRNKKFIKLSIYQDTTYHVFIYFCISLKGDNYEIILSIDTIKQFILN